MNRDRRYQRYENDPIFHQVVRQMGNLIEEHSFTHQDLQDAVFVAYMRHLEMNPVPLLLIRDPQL